MISLRSSLPLLNGVIFPPAPEFVQNRLFPFIAFCVDPYLNKIRCLQLTKILRHTHSLPLTATAIPIPQGSIPILARGRRPRCLSCFLRRSIPHRLHAGHRHGAPRPAPARRPQTRSAPRRRPPRAETFHSRSRRALTAPLAPNPCLNASAAGRRARSSSSSRRRGGRRAARPDRRLREGAARRFR
jgi:hypothetical protein